MAFLRAAQPEDYVEPISGGGVVLRAPSLQDYAEWAELRSQSRDHLTPWEPSWSRDELTKASFRRRLRHYAKESREDLGYAFFITDETSGKLLGGLNVSNIRRGAAQMGTLGYWIAAPFAGQGRMKSAVAAVVPHAFRTLRLHRVEAAVMPANAASISVLQANDFQREGLAKAFLKINGIWEDHYLYARLTDARDDGAQARRSWFG